MNISFAQKVEIFSSASPKFSIIMVVWSHFLGELNLGSWSQTTWDPISAALDNCLASFEGQDINVHSPRSFPKLVPRKHQHREAFRPKTRQTLLFQAGTTPKKNTCHSTAKNHQPWEIHPVNPTTVPRTPPPPKPRRKRNQ